MFVTKPSKANRMLSVLSKLFVRQFYRANTGFFLFFFFLFFGAVEGSSLLTYHLSLIKGILQSTITLLLVMTCWTLYHFKCIGYFFKIINSAEGNFLVNFQALGKGVQRRLCLALYASVYLPVLVYGVIAFFVGLRMGYTKSATFLLGYHLLTVLLFSGFLLFRFNHWLERIKLPALRLPIRKQFLFYLFHQLTTRQRKLFLVLKCFCLFLLYVILVWNRGKYDNDAFLFFYLVIFLAHAVVPYLAVQFFEKEFVVSRNLTVTLLQRALAYFLPYVLLVLPEAFYILYQASSFSFDHKLGYIINLPVSLFLLTAIQYSGAQNREEYIKAFFVLAFASLFAFHVQSFLFWIAAQFVVSVILFGTGYYSFEKEE